MPRIWIYHTTRTIVHLFLLLVVYLLYHLLWFSLFVSNRVYFSLALLVPSCHSFYFCFHFALYVVRCKRDIHIREISSNYAFWSVSFFIYFFLSFCLHRQFILIIILYDLISWKLYVSRIMENRFIFASTWIIHVEKHHQIQREPNPVEHKIFAFSTNSFSKFRLQNKITFFTNTQRIKWTIGLQLI